MTDAPMSADPVVAQDVTVTEALSFLDEGFRNIDLPALRDAEFADIVNALSSFARHRTPAHAGDVRVVPVKPTQAMLDAAFTACVQRDGPKSVWSAMLAASTPDSSAVSGSAEGLREALIASLAKRSVGTMDPPYTAAFNAALDMVASDVAPFLKPGWDEDGICNDHGRFCCADCALPGALTEGQQS